MFPGVVTKKKVYLLLEGIDMQVRLVIREQVKERGGDRLEVMRSFPSLAQPLLLQFGSKLERSIH
jgi:hypothetical protein